MLLTSDEIRFIDWSSDVCSSNLSFGNRVERTACGVSAKIGEERTRRVDSSVFAGEKRTDRKAVPVGESGEDSRLFGPQRQPCRRRTGAAMRIETAPARKAMCFQKIEPLRPVERRRKAGRARCGGQPLIIKIGRAHV